MYLLLQNAQSRQILLIFFYPLFCHLFPSQDKLAFNARENFSTTQSREDFSVNQDFPVNLLQELRSDGSDNNDLLTSQHLPPDLISSSDPFLDLVTSEHLPPNLFPSLLDSTFRPAGDLHHELNLTESDIM